MRPINSFVITRTPKDYPSIMEFSDEIGFKYPFPHYYLYKYDYFNSNEEWKFLKPRPLHERCASVRDGNLNKTGVGIVIMLPKEVDTIPTDGVALIANIIKLVSDDLGIKQYNITTDEINKVNRVDVMPIYSAVSAAPSIFTRRKI